MQLTENDQTTAMPATLPANIFVPSDDYDAATSGSGTASNAPANAPAPPTGNISTTASMISNSVQTALQAANIPPLVIAQIQNSVTRQRQQTVVA